MNSLKQTPRITRLPSSVFPPQMQVLSGSALKLIAVTTMFMDHTGHILLSRWHSASVPLFSFFGKAISLYRIFRDVGRAAFPIFCFLLVEGFLHTSDRLRYARNLFLFALISEIPFNMAFQTESLWDRGHQNVYFTLLFGYLGMWAYEKYVEDPLLQVACLGILAAISMNFHCDYGIKGFLLIMILYLLRDEKAAQTALGAICLHWEWKACFAFLSINMYNGQRGFIRGKAGKYFFYLFYPMHLLLLVTLRYYIFLR